jgi:ribosomal protein S18 acetylase RimI-like enzyme
MTPSEITRRDVRESDRAFLLDLYAAVREPELALTPWTLEQKQAFVEMQFNAQTVGYRDAYPQAAHEVICCAGREVGRIYWSNKPDCLHILDITIAPQSRNLGIGGRVLRDILDAADSVNKSVTIYVESYNPSLRLFERLGFHVITQDGFQLLLERPATQHVHASQE